MSIAVRFVRNHAHTTVVKMRNNNEPHIEGRSQNSQTRGAIQNAQHAVPIQATHLVATHSKTQSTHTRPAHIAQFAQLIQGVGGGVYVPKQGTIKIQHIPGYTKKHIPGEGWKKNTTYKDGWSLVQHVVSLPKTLAVCHTDMYIVTHIHSQGGTGGCFSHLHKPHPGFNFFCCGCVWKGVLSFSNIIQKPYIGIEMHCRTSPQYTP